MCDVACIAPIHYITMHLLSNQHCDWSQQHDMLTYVTSLSKQRRLPVIICAFYFVIRQLTGGIVAHIESRCVIKAKHV